MTDEAKQGGWSDLTEDTIGFGGVEWRTGRDLLLRPRAVLDAYLSGGPTGGGRYARPFRFYVALCGVLMFYLFLVGGTKRLLEQRPPDFLAQMIARSGKTREAFVNDADGWLTFAAVPVLAVFYALSVAPLIKWFGRTDRRIAFRATWALMCAWTVPMLPLGPLPYLTRFQLLTALLTTTLLAIAFWRMGRGRWWTRPWEGAVKALTVVVLVQVGAMIGGVPMYGIGILGGLYGS